MKVQSRHGSATGSGQREAMLDIFLDNDFLIFL